MLLNKAAKIEKRLIENLTKKLNKKNKHLKNLLKQSKK